MDSSSPACHGCKAGCIGLVAKAKNKAVPAAARATAALARRQTAYYKITRIIRFVPELPLTATGKPRKFVMREKMVQESGLTQTHTA